jgi:hypothetical protein
MQHLLSRASKYVENMPPAVAGNHGHEATFAVAVALCHGFALPKNEALIVLREYNQRCCPPWSEKDLEHKLDSAEKLKRHSKPRGYLLGAEWPAQIAKVHSPESGSAAVSVDINEPLPGSGKQKEQHGSAPEKIANPQNEPVIERVEQPEDSSADEAEASRIAAELDRLHRDGAIATKSADDPEAVFYATLLRDFGGTYISRKETRPKPTSPITPRIAAEAHAASLPLSEMTFPSATSVGTMAQNCAASLLLTNSR